MLARVAQRQPGHRAHLLRELARHAGVDGVMATVVRTRRHLVDDQRAILQHEEFYAQHADIVELRDDLQRRRLRARCAIGGHVRPRHGGGEQDAVAVHVFRDRVNDRLPVRAARGQHRHFIRERQHLLEHAGDALHLRECSADLVTRFHAYLSLAVIAHAHGLEYAGEQLVGQRIDVGIGGHLRMRRRQHARLLRAVGEEFFLDQPVLCDRHRRG